MQNEMRSEYLKTLDFYFKQLQNEMQNEMRSEITNIFLVEMLFSCPVLGSCVIINKRFFFFFRFNFLCVWILF